MKTFFVKIGLVCAVLLAGSLHAMAFDGVVVIVNKSVTVDSISVAALKDIYTGRTTYWADGQSVKLSMLEDRINVKADATLEEVSGMDDSHFRIFWQRMVFSGRGQQPQKADDVASLVALVASTKGAIAIVPAHADLKGLKVMDVK